MPIELSHALKNGNLAKLKEPGRYADGRGLYLVVSKTGRRYWQFRATLDGKRKEIGIGSAHIVSLAKAREIASEWRELVRQGKDPRRVRDANKKATITFEDAARQTWAAKIEGVVKNPKHEAAWLSALELHVFPVIGKRELRSLGPRDLADALRPLAARSSIGCISRATSAFELLQAQNQITAAIAPLRENEHTGLKAKIVVLAACSVLTSMTP